MSGPTPYLIFNGDAGAAAAAYAEIFGGAIAMRMTMAEGPPEMTVPEDRRDWLMHCEIRIGDGRLYLSDDYMANSPPMQGNSVMMELPTAAGARAAFDRLAEGGTVTMPFEATFWSAGFGTVVDRFGTRWMIGTAEEPAAETA